MPTAVLPGLTCGDAGLVEDRQRDGRRAGVELADVADRGVVGGRLAGVGRRRARLPAAGLRGRVVERLVLDREVAGLAAGLLERELGAVDRRHGLRPRRALQRQARVDRQLSPPPPPAARAAPAVVAAARPAPSARRGSLRRAPDRIMLASSSSLPSRFAAVAPWRRQRLRRRDRDDRLGDRSRRRVVVDALVGQRLEEARHRQARRCSAPRPAVGSTWLVPVVPLSEYATVARAPRKIDP